MSNTSQTAIGLFGFGCVGQGFYEILNQSGLPFFIPKIGIKHAHKTRPEVDAQFFTERTSIIQDPEIAIIVEVTDDTEQGFEIVKAALLARKPVISANKKMLATYYDELHQLSQSTGTPLLYEAAVGGSIPVFRILQTALANEPIQHIRGIVNGSTNYILTKLTEKNSTYSVALAEAQEAGFAESDPRLDVEGFDALYKVQLLAKSIFGHTHSVQSVRFGIQNITNTELQFARRNQWQIKLVTSAQVRNDIVYVQVMPTFVTATDTLAHVHDEFNAIQVHTTHAGLQTFMGRGAGKFPTGLAVLSDLQFVQHALHLPVRRFSNLHSAQPVTTPYVYLRYAHTYALPANVWEEIVIHDEQAGFIVGKVSWAYLQALEAIQNEQKLFVAQLPLSISPGVARKSLTEQLANSIHLS